MITWQEWGYIIGGYLSGSVLYSYLLPKALKGIDITAESPDGNPGQRASSAATPALNTV